MKRDRSIGDICGLVSVQYLKFLNTAALNSKPICAFGFLCIELGRNGKGHSKFLLRLSICSYVKIFKDMDVVRRLVADRPVVIFSRSTCCMSHSIITLISSFGANPTVYELDKIPNGKQIEKALVQQLGCQPSVPAVFIAQELVGGDKQVMSLQVRNELGPLLMKAGAIWI
ncbi:hypothetical protein SADUNF_Sadunf02G0158200 [Salix dunnii]|uniref:Glutaredoxin domain-containing protein n=1 Tax=Salix dunnii TaxID=1413687 RepID=A0A835THG8_9ROSI|nr:hypothetical protein SADUNF_Sadunf02G0158200 [Salix dunnii]